MDELDDLFNEELNLDKIPETIEVTPEIDISDDNFFGTEENISQSNNSILDEYLKSKGIENATISIIDENEEEQHVSFYDLSKEEQLEILNSSNEETPDLDDSEYELLNHLRSNNLSVNDFLENYKQSIIDSLNVDSVQNYEIDAYDDQELFLLDLKEKYDLTDEELAKELEKELQDEVLFKKKADILRTEYKQLEDQYNEAQEQEQAEQKQQQYDQFSEQMIDVALKTPEFYGIELEDDEKNEVLSFLLDLDDKGTSDFYKTLNDPKKLYEAAWFLRYGKESFDALKNAYESEISRLKKGDNTKIKPVVRNNANDKPKSSIYDLNF